MTNTLETTTTTTDTRPHRRSMVSHLVRPLVTGAFSIATIAIAAAWTFGMAGAEQAFAALAPLTMMIVTFWFKSRSDEE